MGHNDRVPRFDKQIVRALSFDYGTIVERQSLVVRPQDEDLFFLRKLRQATSLCDCLEHSGHALVSAVLAQRYGFTDTDGKQPPPLTLDSA